MISSDVPRRNLITSVMSAAGFIIDVYPEGKAALASIADTTPSTVDPKPWLVILDGSLAAINGSQLLEKIDQVIGRSFQIIVIDSDAFQMPNATEDAQRQKIVDYVNLQITANILKVTKIFWKQRKT